MNTSLYELFDAFKKTILKEHNNMSEFKYTHLLEDVDSTAVDDFYYNEDERKLAVVLADNETVYVYNGVPRYIWDAIVYADSKGSYYARTIKPNFGPAVNLGNYYYIDFVEAERGVPAPSMASATVGTPKGLTLATDAKVSSSVEAFPLSTAAPAKSDTRKHEVVFTTGADSNEFTRTVQAASVDEAVADLNEIAAMLNLYFTIKRVTVHFG